MGHGKKVGKRNKVKIKYTVKPENSEIACSPCDVEITLGQSKNLRCWNVAIPGMKVGGVRRITSSPLYAYGTKGIPPFIGSNTVVVFEVTVVSCN